MTDLPNTNAPAIRAIACARAAWLPYPVVIDVIDFYRSPAMDENLQKAAEQPPNDQSERVLELVRDYGAACRVHGIGPEVTDAYKAVVEAVKGVAA